MRRNILNASDREKAAQLLERWLAGDITNWEIDDEWPWKSEDAGVVDIGDITWRFYSDFPEQTLQPSALTEDERTVILRCLRFLRTTELYLLPEGPAYAPSLLTRLVNRVRRDPGWMVDSINDERNRWWPFTDQAQYLRCGTK